MARLVALEWDGREARVAVARTGGGGAVLQQVLAVDLAPREAGETFADLNVGRQIAEALDGRSLGRVETVVAVGRASIELRVLTVPPAPDDELPDLVRFQALRQFTALGEDWPLDFVVLNRTDEELTVLAATISPELVEQIKQTCATANLTPRSLVLRPFAAASALRHRGMDGRCRMMVDLSADEADLTVLVDQQVVFMRTVRLPAAESVEQTSRVLMGEIRRTMIAAGNQLGGRAVEQVVLCGDQQDYRQLGQQIEQQLKLPVELFDPFQLPQIQHPLPAQLPAHRGRFASLIGMVLDEAEGAAHTIDFLHPRRRPEPPSHAARNAVIGGAIALTVLAMVLVFWMHVAALDRQVRQLSRTNVELIKREQGAKETIDRAEQLDQWVEGDVNWLDQLRLLSEKLPPADEAMVTRMSANAVQGGGRMMLVGVVKDSETIAEVEQAIRDEQHQVRGRGARPVDKMGRFSREFTEMITILPRTEEAAGEPAGAAQATTPAAGGQP